MAAAQVIAKQRVTEHGEVLTATREVNAMLDLVPQETGRIESRFLEPACGNGNFLAVILERKLAVVEARYGRSQRDFEHYAVIAASSVYGIDILEDNVRDCRQRLYDLFDASFYARLFGSSADERCRATVRFVLEHNVTWGDALSLRTVGEKPRHIVFSEWSPVNGSLIKRRDFTFHALLAHEGIRETPLFSDLGEEVFIPTPVKEYPPIHFLDLADGQRG